MDLAGVLIILQDWTAKVGSWLCGQNRVGLRGQARRDGGKGGGGGGGGIVCAITGSTAELARSLQKPESDAVDDRKEKHRLKNVEKCAGIAASACLLVPTHRSQLVEGRRYSIVCKTDQDSDTAAPGSWQRGCLAVTALAQMG